MYNIYILIFFIYMFVYMLKNSKLKKSSQLKSVLIKNAHKTKNE